MNIIELIPKDLLNFLLVSIFSLLIGLEQRRHHKAEHTSYVFGTDRTFTLIGILGFVLYLIGKKDLLFFGIGGIILSLLLTVSYIGKISKDGGLGMTSLLIALITYCLAPLIYTQEPWLVLLIIVSVLLLAESKSELLAFSDKFNKNEFITMAKFIAIVGVVLPLVPDERLIPELDLTPYKFWLAVVAISSISYVSYLLRKFVFPNAGIFLSGILGGAYSSTATTFTLAGKTKGEGFPALLTAAAILIATAMMYLRILLLAFFFNPSVGNKLVFPMISLSLITIGVSLFYWFKHNSNLNEFHVPPIKSQGNPLEFNKALIFALLFLFFAGLSHFVLKWYGNSGINILSFIIGVTDIDPFLLNLFQGKQSFTESLVIAATIQASISNNILKTIYSSTLGSKEMRPYLWIGFGIIIFASILILLFFI